MSEVPRGQHLVAFTGANVARKPRDIDTELKTLADKAKALKARRIVQLGELIVATGADGLEPDVLAGVLLHGVVEARTEKVREGFRADGAAFFQRRGTAKSKEAARPAGQGSAAGHGDGETR